MSTLRAKESFTAFLGGQALTVAAGELLSSEHPVVGGRERLFEVVEDYVANPGRRKTSVSRDDEKRSDVLMERATSEPGERRSVDTKTGVQEKEKPKSAPAAARRSPVKVDESDLPKGKKDGEV